MFFEGLQQHISQHVFATWMYDHKEEEIQVMEFKHADHDVVEQKQLPNGTPMAASCSYTCVVSPDNSASQDARKHARVNMQLEKLIKVYRLSKVEMTTAIVPRVGGALSFDVLRCNVPPELAKALASRYVFVMSRAYGMAVSDRKAVMFAPIQYGGDACKHLFTELVLATTRETLLYMNSGSVAARARQMRLLAILTLNVAQLIRMRQISCMCLPR